MASRKSSCTNTVTNNLKKKKFKELIMMILNCKYFHINCYNDSVAVQNPKNYIGCCFDHKVSGEFKYKLLANVRVADEKYTFPISGKRNLLFQFNCFKGSLVMIY